MKTRIPVDAFDYYVSLGPERSYEAVAAHFGVSASGVKKASARDHWQSRLAQIDTEVQARLVQRIVDEIDEMRDRHLKTVRAIMGRALKALQQFPLTSGMEAVRAAELAIKLERLVMGEASERTEINTDDVIRQEMKRWLVPRDADIDLAAEMRGFEGAEGGGGTGSLGDSGSLDNQEQT